MFTFAGFFALPSSVLHLVGDMFSTSSRRPIGFQDAAPAPQQPAHGFTAVSDMGLGNFQGCAAGRISMSSAPVQHGHESRRILNPTPNYGLMASSFRGRKNLICFYCNKRSDIRYDGLMTRWDCTKCDSTNFLDEVFLPCPRSCFWP